VVFVRRDSRSGAIDEEESIHIHHMVLGMAYGAACLWALALVHSPPGGRQGV